MLFFDIAMPSLIFTPKLTGLEPLSLLRNHSSLSRERLVLMDGQDDSHLLSFTLYLVPHTSYFTSNLTAGSLAYQEIRLVRQIRVKTRIQPGIGAVPHFKIVFKREF